MTTPAPAGRKTKSPLERVLSVFTDIEPGEGMTALLLTANVFLLLLAYYLIKTVREPLILQSGGGDVGGAELKSYATAAQAILLIPVAKGYDLLTRRFGRMKLISIVTIFFASNLLLFWILAGLNVPYLGIAFYLWVGVFNLTIVAQFWSFANDIYDEDQGKRLFPIVAAGSAMGAVIGGYSAAFLPFGPYTLMVITALLLVGCLGFTFLVHRRESISPTSSDTSDAQIEENARRKEVAEKPVGSKRDAFAMVLRDKYLLCIAALTMMRNTVNTTGEYILDRTILDIANAEVARGAAESVTDFIKTFRGTFFGTVNLLQLFIQFLLVSRILKYLGVRWALIIVPLITFAGHSTMALFMTLTVITVAKTIDNSVDYSLQNTAQQALFLLTGREEKYKAKAVIDTFIWRSGDLLAAGLIFMGTKWFLFETKQFILMNMGIALVWLGVAILLGRAHKERENQRTSVSPPKPALA